MPICTYLCLSVLCSLSSSLHLRPGHSAIPKCWELKTIVIFLNRKWWNWREKQIILTTICVEFWEMSIFILLHYENYVGETDPAGEWKNERKNKTMFWVGKWNPSLMANALGSCVVALPTSWERGKGPSGGEEVRFSLFYTTKQKWILPIFLKMHLFEILQNRQKVKTTQICTNWWISEQNVLSLYRSIICDNRNEAGTLAPTRMNCAPGCWVREVRQKGPGSVCSPFFRWAVYRDRRSRLQVVWGWASGRR